MLYKSLYLPDMIKWEEDSLSDKFGRLEITPLERGFGRTLGNSLRRVLLSLLEGFAPVSLSIEGVEHQFSTIPGVVQDVTELVLNVKSLVFNLQGEEKGSVSLNVSEQGKFTGRDLTCDKYLKVINEDQEIAQLDGSGKLSMEITVEKGKGFIPADEWSIHGKEEKAGTILLDSWFCPVRKVNFQVKSARVGDRTDFDHLIMDIITDGSIDPKEAVNKACEIITQHLQMIPDGLEPEEKPDLISEEKDSKNDFLSFGIDDTDIPTRIANVLKSAGIKTVNDLLETKSADILKIGGFGPSSLDTVNEVLKKQNLLIDE
ncbi:MAG: DNA-directed RNA polymerase subunit alpha [Candidatus Aegiribacteria sp.]|nr:DNA-directed RNA polymerase subunit alpha [Candidatus Aegiribacteria sp.]